MWTWIENSVINIQQPQIQRKETLLRCENQKINWRKTYFLVTVISGNKVKFIHLPNAASWRLPKIYKSKAEEKLTQLHKHLSMNHWLKIPQLLTENICSLWQVSIYILTFFPLFQHIYVIIVVLKKCILDLPSIPSFIDGFKSSNSVTHRSCGNVLPGHSTPPSKQQWFIRWWCSSFTTKSQTQRWEVLGLYRKGCPQGPSKT